MFCLLLHFYHTENWKIELQIWSKHWCIDIKKTSRIHADLLDQDLLNLHALSGCDTVPMMYGTGKKKSLTSYKKQPASSLHLPDEQLALTESKRFVASWFSTNKLVCSECSSENRCLIWNSYTKRCSKPSLKALPPTDEALNLNILQARFEAILWHSALNSKPPTLDLCSHSWERDEDTRTPIAPEEALRSVTYACLTTSCVTNACGCKKIWLKCSEFCLCKECENIESNCFVSEDESASDSENEDILE